MLLILKRQRLRAPSEYALLCRQLCEPPDYVLISWANDLALRLIHAHALAREKAAHGVRGSGAPPTEMDRRECDTIVVDHAYHGHSVSVIDISPYKCGPALGAEGVCCRPAARSHSRARAPFVRPRSTRQVFFGSSP